MPQRTQQQILHSLLIHYKARYVQEMGNVLGIYAKAFLGIMSMRFVITDTRHHYIYS